MKRFNQFIIALVLILASNISVLSQVGIGTSTPDSKAQLDVSSTTKGFLPPRMTYAQRELISSPPAGLMIWCSNCGTSGQMQFYNGTSWVTFSEQATSAPITLTCNTPTSITNTTASASGSLTGVTGPTTYGFVYSSTSSTPTMPAMGSTSSTSSMDYNSGTGSFSASLTGLTLNTSYYIRAYYYNNSTMTYSYSSVITFSTANNPVTTPTVTTTSPASGLTSTGATLQGQITSDGGGSISQAGFHYNTTNTFTNSSDYTTYLGSSYSNTINGTLTGLSANTTYYFRAFATNSAGTGTGSSVSFTTSAPSAPSVSFMSANSTSTGTISASANITQTGGANITAVGFEYSTNSAFTTGVTSVSATVPTSPMTTFNKDITSVPAGTYYIRAYATNSVGTTYSSNYYTTVTVN